MSRASCLTKLDGTAKGGIVIAVQRELGVPVKLVGLGEGADDLAPFEAAAFVDALLGNDAPSTAPGRRSAPQRPREEVAARAGRSTAPTAARSGEVDTGAPAQLVPELQHAHVPARELRLDALECAEVGRVVADLAAQRVLEVGALLVDPVMVNS